MDSITHVALGAAVGEVMAGKKLGKHAMFVGAIAQSLPDIDFVASFWMSFSENLLAHRGFTHSFLFVLLTTTGLALLADRWYQKPDMRFRAWFLFLGVQMSVHILLDACNAYGTGWFEPFSHERIAFHFLFVADPFFSFPLIVAALALLLLRKNYRWRVRFASICLAASVAYAGNALINKVTINSAVRTALVNQKIPHTRFLSTPTALNSWLWFIAAESDSGFYVGHRSVFDSSPNIDFHYFPQNKHLLDSIADHENLQHLIRFSEGYYTVENRGDTLIFNDLRFTQITGWATPHAKFVFHFYLSHPDDNLLVIQRGRFANWNGQTVRELIERIKGN